MNIQAAIKATIYTLVLLLIVVFLIGFIYLSLLYNPILIILIPITLLWLMIYFELEF